MFIDIFQINNKATTTMLYNHLQNYALYKTIVQKQFNQKLFGM